MLAYTLRLEAIDYDDNTVWVKETKHMVSNNDDLLKLEAECDRLNEELQRELSNVKESSDWGDDDGLIYCDGEYHYDGWPFTSPDDIKWTLNRDRKNDVK